MRVRRASRYLGELVAVSPILEAISNGISALPAPTLVGQLASGQGGKGGFASTTASTFASTFAAARGVAGASQSVADGLETSDGSTADAEAVTLHMPVLGAGNSQLRKLPNSSLLETASTMAAMNVVVPGFISATAAQIPSSEPQTLTAVAQAQIPDELAGTVQTSVRTTAYDAAVRSTPAGYSAPSSTAVSLNSASLNSASFNPSSFNSVNSD